MESSQRAGEPGTAPQGMPWERPHGACARDRGLMESLGLKTDGYGRNTTLTGTVALPAAQVRVEVTAMPATFWRFTVDAPDAENLAVVSTGSGDFTEYWPLIELLATGTPFDEVTRTAAANGLSGCLELKHLSAGKPHPGF